MRILPLLLIFGLIASNVMNISGPNAQKRQMIRSEMFTCENSCIYGVKIFKSASLFFVRELDIVF